MSSIVVTPKDKAEAQFLEELLTKLGISSTLVSDEEMEDLGLALLMKEVDRSDYATEEEVLKKLKS